MDFDPQFWLDKGTYWLNTAPQSSPEWHSLRKFRLTGSNFGTAIGLSKFSTPLELALDICSLKHKKFSSQALDNMNHGTKMEPIVRNWYAEKYNCQVEEVGLAVPKWEPRIGSSLDGDIIGTDGMIEIKCPKTMYTPLITHMDKIAHGWVPEKFYHEHIWPTHYAQIQGGLKINNKQWCDYIVYASESNRVYVERIDFNKTYWDDILWVGIQNFLTTYLEPLKKDGWDCTLFKNMNY